MDGTVRVRVRVRGCPFAPNSSLEIYFIFIFFCIFGVFVCLVFFPLRVWIWTLHVSQADDQNVSGKVEQRISFHHLLFFKLTTLKGGSSSCFADYFADIGGFFFFFFCGYWFHFSVTEVDTNYNQQRSGPELQGAPTTLDVTRWIPLISEGKAPLIYPHAGCFIWY